VGKVEDAFDEDIRGLSVTAAFAAQKVRIQWFDPLTIETDYMGEHYANGHSMGNTVMGGQRIGTAVTDTQHAVFDGHASQVCSQEHVPACR
jgi:hypothetical protein